MPTKVNGSFSATTSFSTFYTMTSNPTTRAFITVNGGPSMVMCFFDWSGGSYPSLTLLASSGNATQAALTTSNTGAGVNALSIQQNGNTGQIQIKATSAMTVIWFITFM